MLQDDGRFLILLVTALGAFASIAAIVFELGASNRSAPGLALATVTIALSWAAVHTAFSLHYAHEYYRGGKPGGLQFPSGDQHEDADYWDFVYFSFVIGMTAQVSDVGITDKIIRRTATVHGIISFVFNTALVALMVNIARKRDLAANRAGGRADGSGTNLDDRRHLARRDLRVRPSMPKAAPTALSCRLPRCLRCHCEVSHPDIRCDSRA